MDQFISFFQSHYKIIVIIFEFCCSFIVTLILSLRLHRTSSLYSDSASENLNNLNDKYLYIAISKLPYWITEANLFFPNEGIKTGPLKLQYVKNKFNSFLDECKVNRMDDRSISEIINNILLCDKIFSLKEVSYEENQSKTVERPESVRQDGESDESPQRQAYYVPRRD